MEVETESEIVTDKVEKVNKQQEEPLALVVQKEPSTLIIERDSSKTVSLPNIDQTKKNALSAVKEGKIVESIMLSYYFL